MRKPFNAHYHGREGPTLKAILKYVAERCAAATFMPNLEAPNAVRTGPRAKEYREEIVSALNSVNTTNFLPVMTIEITEQTTVDDVIMAHAMGVRAGKVYPRGRTTNSQDGVANYRKILPVLRAMAEYRMLALLHGETPNPGTLSIDREKAFHATLLMIIKECPGLQIVVEHVSTMFMADYIMQQAPDNVAMTLTSHHLVLTLNDVIDDKMRPHNFCRPVAKTAEDRAVLVSAAISGHPRVFWGSDSAVHPKNKKEGAEACAGVFSEPVAIPVLAEIFERHNALSKLEDFTSTFGARFYDLELWDDTLTLVQTPWVVPADIAGFVPWKAGETMQWQFA